MKTITMAIICLRVAAAETIDHYANRVADAIYLIEGGPRAKVPYGILSVKVRDKAEARAVCKRTVLHALRDWDRRTGEPFTSFLAKRYCPVGSLVWRRNLNRQLRR